MKSSVLMEQIALLKNSQLRFDVDNNSEKELDDSFSEIYIYKNGSVDKNTIRVEFEDYIIRPFPGFDLHDKWNNGIAPPSKIMYGTIEKETQKMYRFNVMSDTGTSKWSGWCPKKSCKISYNGG